MLHSGHWSATRPVPVEELFRGGVGDPDGGGGIELARVPDPLTGMRSHPHAGHRARAPGAAFNFCPQPPQVKVSFITKPDSSRFEGNLVGGAHGRAELGFPQGESRAARGRGSDVESTPRPTRSAFGVASFWAGALRLAAVDSGAGSVFSWWYRCERRSHRCTRQRRSE